MEQNQTWINRNSQNKINFFTSCITSNNFAENISLIYCRNIWARSIKTRLPWWIRTSNLWWSWATSSSNGKAKVQNFCFPWVTKSLGKVYPTTVQSRFWTSVSSTFAGSGMKKPIISNWRIRTQIWPNRKTKCTNRFLLFSKDA